MVSLSNTKKPIGHAALVLHIFVIIGTGLSDQKPNFDPRAVDFVRTSSSLRMTIFTDQDKEQRLTAKDSLPLLSLDVLVDIARPIAAVFLKPVHTVSHDSKSLRSLGQLPLHISPVTFVISSPWGWV